MPNSIPLPTAAPVATASSDPEAQQIYNILNSRGVFKQDPEAQQIGHILRARGVVSDPTQGGLITPQPAASANATPPPPLPTKGPFVDPLVARMAAEVKMPPVQFANRINANNKASGLPPRFTVGPDGSVNSLVEHNVATPAAMKAAQPGVGGYAKAIGQGVIEGLASNPTNNAASAIGNYGKDVLKSGVNALSPALQYPAHAVDAISDARLAQARTAYANAKTPAQHAAARAQLGQILAQRRLPQNEWLQAAEGVQSAGESANQFAVPGAGIGSGIEENLAPAITPFAAAMESMGSRGVNAAKNAAEKAYIGMEPVIPAEAMKHPVRTPEDANPATEVTTQSQSHVQPQPSAVDAANSPVHDYIRQHPNATVDEVAAAHPGTPWGEVSQAYHDVHGAPNQVNAPVTAFPVTAKQQTGDKSPMLMPTKSDADVHQQIFGAKETGQADNAQNSPAKQESASAPEKVEPEEKQTARATTEPTIREGYIAGDNHPSGQSIALKTRMAAEKAKAAALNAPKDAADLAAQLKQHGMITDEHIPAITALVNARADAWARETGRPATEYVPSRFAGVTNKQPGAAALRQEGAHNPQTETPEFKRGSKLPPTYYAAEDLLHTETGQDTYKVNALVKKLRSGKEPAPGIITKDGNDTQLLDGHHRALSLEQLGRDIPTIGIRKDVFESLKSQGHDSVDILAGVYKAAGYNKEVTYLDKKFPGGDVAKNSEAIAAEIRKDPTALFQSDQGAMSIAKDGRAVIHALKSPNVSTAIHELFHVFRQDAAERDVKVMGDWAGVKGGTWERSHEEAVARAFERYAREGKAPIPALKEAFGNFKQWLTTIYSTIKGSPIDQKLTPELRGAFDRMLGNDGEAKVAKPAGNAKSRARAEFNQKLGDYFKPGNIVKGYGRSRDRVISFQPLDEDGNWSVEVQEVDNNNKPIGNIRSHKTLPGARDLAGGPIETNSTTLNQAVPPPPLAAQYRVNMQSGALPPQQGGPGLARNIADIHAQVRNATTRNLNQLRQLASPDTYNAAVRLGGATPQVNVQMNGVMGKIAKTLNGQMNVGDFNKALTESRLMGVRNRWDKFAKAMPVVHDADIVTWDKNNHINGLTDLHSLMTGNLARNPNLRNLVEGVHNALGTAERTGDTTDLKDALADLYTHARNGVPTLYKNPADYATTTSNPAFKAALQIYKDNIEKAMATSHTSNEGIFSNELGPLKTYYPLTPMNAKGELVKRGGGVAEELSPRVNIHNNFATGQSPDYDFSAQSLRKAFSGAVHRNAQADFVRSLQQDGLIRKAASQVIDKDGNVKNVLNIKGKEYPATEVFVKPGLTIVNDGKVIHTQPTKMWAPNWLIREASPLLHEDWEGWGKERGDIENKVLSTITSSALGGSPAGVVHAQNLYSGYLTRAAGPALVHLLGGEGGIANIGKRFSDLTTVNPEKDTVNLSEMSDLGILPERYGESTASKVVSEQTGAKYVNLKSPASWVKSEVTHYVLFGDKGLDVRARMATYKAFKAMAGFDPKKPLPRAKNGFDYANPKAAAQLADLVTDALGQYNPALQSRVIRGLRTNWLGNPFATAAVTATKLGTKEALGMGPMNVEGMTPAAKIANTVAQKLVGSLVGVGTVWMATYHAATGKWPWQDKDSKFLKIPVTSKNQIGQSKFGKAYREWVGAKDGEAAYINVGALNPAVTRGPLVQAAAGAYNAAAPLRFKSQPVTRAEAGEHALLGAVNGAASPFVEGPVPRAIAAGTAFGEPYLSGIRDPITGKAGPQFVPAGPTYAPGGGLALGARATAVSASLSPVISGLEGLAGAGPQARDFNQHIPLPTRIAKGVMPLLAPRLYGGQGNSGMTAKQEVREYKSGVRAAAKAEARQREGR